MRTGYLLSETQAKKAGYRLLCALFAAYDFPVLRRDDDPDPLDSFLEYQEEEMSEDLIKLAAICRACDDELGILKDLEGNFPAGVGELVINKGKPQPLNIREACNKIIHAKSVEYDFAWSEANPIWERWFKSQGYKVRNQYKVPALKLSGKQVNGKEWMARVELVPFIFATSLWNMWQWKLA